MWIKTVFGGWLNMSNCYLIDAEKHTEAYGGKGRRLTRIVKWEVVAHMKETAQIIAEFDTEDEANKYIEHLICMLNCTKVVYEEV